MIGFAAKGIVSIGNGGRGEQATVPEKRLRMCARRRKGQRAEEEVFEGEDGKEEAVAWRCLSFLERRSGGDASEEAEAAEEEEEEDDLW